MPDICFFVRSNTDDVPVSVDINLKNPTEEDYLMLGTVTVNFKYRDNTGTYGSSRATLTNIRTILTAQLRILDIKDRLGDDEKLSALAAAFGNNPARSADLGTCPECGKKITDDDDDLPEFCSYFCAWENYRKREGVELP